MAELLLGGPRTGREHTVKDPDPGKDSLVHRCTRRGVSLMMTHEIPELSGLTRLSEHGVAQLADTSCSCNTEASTRPSPAPSPC
jgi:hypothetical protein